MLDHHHWRAAPCSQAEKKIIQCTTLQQYKSTHISPMIARDGLSAMQKLPIRELVSAAAGLSAMQNGQVAA